jgi:serine/threonine-protein kinase PknK
VTEAAPTVLAHRYRLGAALGHGGSAHTYVADDLLEGRSVALKLLDATHDIDLLRREFERLRGIVHPHLTRVHAFGVARLAGGRRAFYTAELVRGGDLRAFAAKAALADLKQAFGDVLDALDLLHRLGLRHGDVKPENVLLDAAGRAVLIDLGCAAPLGQTASALSGTHGYLAPELLAGSAADERADLFALGVTMREVCGEGARAALEPLLLRLTSPRPGERPSSAREVLASLGDTRDVANSTRGRAARCIGRDEPIAQARRALLTAAAGEPGPRCVWVEGSPGVGRSRLLRELGFALAGTELDAVEARALGDCPLRAALERKVGVIAAGFEALQEQLHELAAAREPCVLVLDDAQQLSPEAKLELRFALASLPARGRLSMLIASSEPPPELADDSSLLRVALGPLTQEALAEWSQGLVAPARLGELLRYTGGYPRYVERTLAALASGRLRDAELSEGAPGGLDAESARSLRLALTGLSAAEQRVLAQIALLGESGEPPSARLLERDLIVQQGAGFDLVRQADRAELLAALPAHVSRALHAQAARVLAARDLPEAWAKAIAYFVAADLPAEASASLAAHEQAALREPRLFSHHLLPCARALPAAQRVLLARLLRLAGESARALTVLAETRRRHASPALYLESAEVYLALGRARRAERMLSRCYDASQPAHAELMARVLVRKGAYERARDVALSALPDAAESGVRARLLEALAIALTYLDQCDEARARVDEALALHSRAELRACARCLSLRGFVALRAGAFAEAASAYREAYELAEPAGLVDLVLNALSNLGNARQSLGQWGAALETYERALRLAQALDRRVSVRSLRANLANLALEIGSFARAREALVALEHDAPAGHAGSALERSIVNYRAELSLLEGDPAATLQLLSQRPEHAASASREQVEARVYAASALLALGEPKRSLAELKSACPDPRQLAADLAARVAEVEGQALAASGRAREGVELLELALARVRQSADQALVARLETGLSELCRGLSADALAQEHAARARARWERIALDLPHTLREVFWAHPRRARLPRELPQAASSEQGRATLSLSRVRELNRRIGALHDRAEVLSFALAAAIELTAAERGFVLLHDASERGFVVAAAQNMDGARMRKSDWKWSRSIAERVIRQGEPVLTVDAGSDPRFARQASVHAMQLKSVLCAPIRGRDAVRGALYLDNRLARARFAADDSELLLTFADQVAIALTHAELVQALSHKAEELAREKRKVEALARGQAAQIERLSDELSVHRANLTMRYDYDAIVGRSEPMRRVLAVLDRVIDSDLSVLIQGESGTGKELIARALHTHGARKDKPFVGINCAALPETLLESELFGHVKGAFTGASTAREGLFVTARGGVLFLDELGELPLSMQAKLLRVLSDGEVRPVGSTKTQKVDVRLVCATNRRLKDEVAAGRFREDLYYRVGVVELSLPALRERHEDIVPIAESILRARAKELGASPLTLSAGAVRTLLAHAWPGNVRELQNTLLRASVMATGGTIESADLGLLPDGVTLAREGRTTSTRAEYARKEAERLLAALEAERWNVSRVAKRLGIPRNTLYRKLARYGIQRLGE